MYEISLHFALGFIAAILGALPFGLVNLSVIYSVLHKGERAAFKLSAGATIIEIVFVLLAIFLGSRLENFIDSNRWIEFVILAVLLAAGISFFIRKNKKDAANKKFLMPDLIKGMFLNILSIQVLLYWFVAVTYLQAYGLIVFTLECIVAFTLAVTLGKMLTLLFYRLLAQKIKSKSLVIARKINFIIGSILIGLAVFQLTKVLIE
jgi:threonine/homoserine/homoserine lactone efflux protein